MFSAQDPSFGLWQRDGTATTLQKGRTFDARVKLGEAFTISADGTQIRFGLGVGSKIPVQFDLRAATLLASPAAVAGLTQPNTGSLDVKDLQDLEHPLYNGRPIALDKYEISRSVAIRNDRAGFVLGADYWLRGIAANGKELWKQPVPGAAWGVNFARGGEIVAAAYGDGTIRWHRWSDGQELLALFVDSVSRHWVAWTPSGYYMASPGGEDLIGWHVNRGWDEPADFFPASRFRDRFNRPDIVELMLETLDESVAVRQANDAAHRRADTKPIEAALPPVLKIVTPQQGTTFSGATVELAYTVRSPSGLPIDKVDILIDGSPTGAFARGVDAATASKEKLQRTGYKSPIVTQIVPAALFWKAEDYHQQYLAKRGLGSCHL